MVPGRVSICRLHSASFALYKDRTIRSAKTLFSNKVTFPGLRGQDLDIYFGVGDTILPHAGVRVGPKASDWRLCVKTWRQREKAM